MSTDNIIIYIFWLVIKSLAWILPLLGAVAYYTYAERKLIAYMQLRLGPNRVGWYGLLQPIADSVKLFLKEFTIPQAANRFLFIAAPLLTLVPSLAAWAVLPLSAEMYIAEINLSLLYVFAMTSLGVYGVIFAGWSSNSKYALLGALRSAAQLISYELAMGFVLLGVVLASGSANLLTIVAKQAGGFWNWWLWPLFPLFVVYWICIVAETNRAPFDVAEGESELVAGFHVEYSGAGFALFFLAEYANMILLSFLAAILFLGGWHPPLPVSWLQWVPSMVWLVAKASIFMFSFIWLRATLPRLRYDQIMTMGWQYLIPVCLVWLVLEAVVLFFYN